MRTSKGSAIMCGKSSALLELRSVVGKALTLCVVLFECRVGGVKVMRCIL